MANPVMIAYPIPIGINVSLVAIFTVFFLKERFGMVHNVEIVLVILGVSCLAWAECRS